MANRDDLPQYMRRVSRCSSSLGGSTSRAWVDDGQPLPDMTTCAICGTKAGDRKKWARPGMVHPRFLVKVVCHHIKPLRCGGEHAAGNIIFLCESCHGRVENRLRKTCRDCDRESCTAHQQLEICKQKVTHG